MVRAGVRSPGAHVLPGNSVSSQPPPESTPGFIFLSAPPPSPRQPLPFLPRVWPSRRAFFRMPFPASHHADVRVSVQV